MYLFLPSSPSTYTKWIWYLTEKTKVKIFCSSKEGLRFLIDHQFNQDFILNCIFKEWKLFSTLLINASWFDKFSWNHIFSRLAIDFPSNSFLLHEAHKSSVMLSNANDCLNWWNIYAGNDGPKLAKLQLDNLGLVQLAASEMTLQEFVSHKCHWTLMAGTSIWKRVIRKLHLCFTK